MPSKPLMFVFVVLALSSCSAFKVLRYMSGGGDEGSLVGNEFRSKQVVYRVGSLGEGWERVKLPGGDLAFHNPSLGAAVTVSSACGVEARQPLSVLAKSQVIGVGNKEVLSSERLVVDGVPALKIVWRGEVEGETVLICGIVLKRGGCVFDLVYTSVPDGYERGLGEFLEFVQSFAFVRRP